MKKRLLTVALAVSVLFSFTACDIFGILIHRDYRHVGDDNGRDCFGDNCNTYSDCGSYQEAYQSSRKAVFCPEGIHQVLQRLGREV